jgi:nucleoside phosphorylase
MIAILFSTPQEAAIYLRNYNNGRFEGISEGEHTYDDHLLIGITGTGKIKATLRTERLLQHIKPSCVLHIGTSTKLNPKLDSLAMVSIHQVFEGDRMELHVPMYPRMPLDCPFSKLPTGTLVTQDHILKENNEKVYWERLADVCDMEGYAIAYTAAASGIPCHIVKVAIGESKAGDVDFKRTLQDAYQIISDFLLKPSTLKALIAAHP